MAEVKAQLNNLRLAPRKVRTVVGLIKGKKVVDALDQIEYLVKRPAPLIKKLLNSAVANAENNFNMVKDNLYIKSIIVNEGIKLKRFKAKGFGRAALIQKKTSHIKLVLDELTPGLRQEKKSKAKTSKETTTTTEEKRVYESKKPEIKKEIGSKAGILDNFGKKFFRRKSI